jgi:hypothetical protein
MSNNHSFAHVEASRRLGLPTDYEKYPAPMADGALERLTSWFAGSVALTRSEAHRLLDAAVEAGQMKQHRAEFVAAIKALAVGPSSNHGLGYRLLPDD